MPTTNSEYAWTGDTKGYEFLFENKIFESISNKISNTIIKYLQLLEINTKLRYILSKILSNIY